MKGRQFDNSLRMILSWLMGDEVSRIGVCGVGGVGKTTLATHIHDQLLHFLGKSASVYWVTVSQKCTLLELQRKIAKELKLSDHVLEEADKIRRSAILSKALKNKNNVVVILDDMCNHFPVEEVGLPTGKNQCKLLLTTRSQDVCRKMACQRQVKVEPLSKEESWSLFAERLGNCDDLSSEAKGIAKLVAKECAGLPLGIISVAASMRGIIDVYEWNNTLEELTNPTRIHEEMEREVFPSLQLSYDQLNDVMLQKCFRSCALYPKDYELARDKLVNLWIMEGHLEGIQSRQKQLDKAHSMLNRLVSACLLDAPDLTTNVVKMHDLIRDMAVRISSQRHHVMIKAGMHLRQVPRLQEWTEELTKVSLVRNGIIEIPSDMTPVCPNLSCLLLQGNRLLTIPDSFLLGFNGLKFLDLSETFISRVPNCVSDLVNLSALNLAGCINLRYVPSLAKLTKLRHLNLRDCYEICHLPEGMEKLVNLERLVLTGCDDLFVPFSQLTIGLSNIQCLELSCGVEDAQIKDILKLGCLQKLTGWRTQDMGTFNTYVRSQQFLQLTSYELILGYDLGPDPYCGLYNMCISIMGIKFEGGAEPAQLPHNIQVLEVLFCDFQVWSLVDALPSLDSLTRLKRIFITRSKGLECIWSESSCAKPTLENLEHLMLSDLVSFRALAKGRVELLAFSSLKKLAVENCCAIEKLFTPCLLNGQLRNLEEIYIMDCRVLEEIFAGFDLDDESGAATIEVNRVNTMMISLELPKLRLFSLYNLPSLVSICKTGLLCCKSIEEINVWGCPKLKKLPIMDHQVLGNGKLSPPPCLQKIKVEREWWKSLVWGNHSIKHTLEPFLQFVSSI